MLTFRQYRLLALLLAALLIPWLHGCARNADGDQAPSPADSATAQSAAETPGANAPVPLRSASDTTWNCPPEVDGPVISLRSDTGSRHPKSSEDVIFESGEFEGSLATIYDDINLNSDSLSDITLLFESFASSWGEGFFAIYVGCGDSHFKRVWGPDYAFKLTTGAADTVNGNWKPIIAFSREGEAFKYVFSDSTYERKR